MLGFHGAELERSVTNVRICHQAARDMSPFAPAIAWRRSPPSTTRSCSSTTTGPRTLPTPCTGGRWRTRSRCAIRCCATGRTSRARATSRSTRLREPASGSGEPLPSRAGSIPPCRSRQQPCEGAIPGATVTPTSLAPGQERTFRSRAPGLDTALPPLTCTA